MADSVAIDPGAPAIGEVSGADDVSPSRFGSAAIAALTLLPGVLIVFLGFNSGGYFPQTPALGAIVLAQVLLVRIMQSRRPFEGLAPTTLIAIAALGLYAVMSLISAAWSHSTSRALVEFDRAWMYLLILVLFGTVRASTKNLRWLIRGIVVGASIVCVSGLLSRVLPNVLHTAPDVSNQRLSYPVTYWNTLGLLASLGALLAFHITCSLGERRLARVLAAAVIPLLLATLFFTFSRGAIGAGLIGVVIYVLVGRPSGLLSGVIATLPASIVMIAVAYHANLLDTVDPTTPAAVSQGHRVAWVAGICAVVCAGLRLVLATRLDPWLRHSSGRPWMTRERRWVAIAATVAAVLVVAAALGVPHTVEGDWHRFISGVSPQGEGHDLRERLTDPSNDGRTPLWRVALHALSASPLHGYGAGMYQAVWDRHRALFAYVVNAHSLYFQAMAELGIPGIALLVVLIGTVLIGLARRARGSQRSLYGALLAAAVVWAVRAGVDWDWEMPVVTVGFFAAAGLALAPRKGSGPGWIPGEGTRTALGLVCLISIVAPVLIIGSQGHINDAKQDLYHAANCKSATSEALSAISWLDVRPEPYEIIGFCDIQRGLPRLGVYAMEQAASVDPGSWEPYYALAIARAASGLDPRADAKRALRMNPLEPLTREEAKLFDSSNPAEWVNQASVVRAAALSSGDLSIAPS